MAGTPTARCGAPRAFRATLALALALALALVLTLTLALVLTLALALTLTLALALALTVTVIPTPAPTLTLTLTLTRCTSLLPRGGGKPGAELQVVRAYQHCGAITCVEVGADGLTVLTGAADGTLVLWVLLEPARHAAPLAPPRPVRLVAQSSPRVPLQPSASRLQPYASRLQHSVSRCAC